MLSTIVYSPAGLKKKYGSLMIHWFMTIVKDKKKREDDRIERNSIIDSDVYPKAIS
jgi:hypothetical protein